MIVWGVADGGGVTAVVLGVDCVGAGLVAVLPQARATISSMLMIIESTAALLTLMLIVCFFVCDVLHKYRPILFIPITIMSTDIIR